jgi:hypothetical protein
MNAVIKDRYLASKNYLISLEASQFWDWEEKYNCYKKKMLTMPEAMVLVHPRFYKDIDTDWEPRGTRSFESIVVTGASKCQSEILWLYKCESSISIVFHGDHLWPRGLGGPTVSSNKAILCDMHNFIKGMDIHNYPWEQGIPDWYEGLLEQIKAFRNRFL